MTHSDESHKQPREKDLSFLDAAESFYPHFTLRHYLLVAGVVIPGLLLLPAVYHYFANHGLFPFLNTPQSQAHAAPDQPPSPPTQQQPQSGLAQTQSADTIMSNGYQVGPDGFLIQPKHNIALPELPEAARENTPEGANAFSEHYIHVYSYAFLTGDTTELRKLSVPECESCEGRASVIEAFYGKGGWIDGTAHQIRENQGTRQLTEEDKTKGYWNTYLIVQAPERTVYENKKLAKRKEENVTMLITTQWINGEWKAVDTATKESD